MNNQGTSTRHEPAILTALFRDRESSDAAYRSLRDRGYSDDDILVMMSDETRDKFYKDDPASDLGNKSLEGVGVGSIIGGTLGAVVGGIAAIGTNLVLPGLGLVVAGPLAAAIAGAGVGGAAGGLTGALIGWGIPEDRAEIYEQGIREGGTLLGVRPRTADDADYLRNEWKTNFRGEHTYL